MPSKTGPPNLPEKMIIAAKTGPPALPVKPKMNSINANRYPEQLHQQLPPFRTYHYQQPSQSHLSIDTSSTPAAAPSDDYKSLPHFPTASPASSMLHIPGMISRTATGNSSIISSTSTSSQNSTSTSSKRGWHISSWFTNQQQQQQEQHEQLKNSIRRSDSNVMADMDTLDPLSPEVTGSSSNATSKRTKVIDELLETERAYQKDMSLLKSIYYDGAVNAGLSKADVRHLFSNLTDIVEFEKTFVTLLEHSCQQDSVGTSFRETVSWQSLGVCMSAG